MKAKCVFAAAAALVLAGVARGEHSFAYGHVFVSLQASDPCDFGGPEAIVEIDPATGTSSVFADSNDGICLITGLRFAPHDNQLLALNLGHIVPGFDGGWVQAFNPDGTSELILDASDGLFGPNGANALAFDESGDLYVVNGENSTILRFPADGGPGTVFADWTDGIADRGALDFAPNGDLFYCGDLAGAIIRITPDGESSVFDDTLLFPSSLVFDPQGNLFVSASSLAGRTIYRYDDGDADSRRVLATGFLGGSGIPSPLALSRDGSVVYLAEIFGLVYSIDAEDGTTTVVADLSDLPYRFPLGITVYAPDLPVIPTVSAWGNVVIALLVLGVGALVLIRRRSVSVTRKG